MTEAEKEYTVVLVRLMSQVHTVTAGDLKAAVAQAMNKETLQPDCGTPFDAAGDVEVQVIEADDEEVWNADRDSEDDIY